MLFTLGGLGVWVFLDFFYFLFMNYQDLQSDYVTRRYNRLLLCLVPLVFVFGALSLFYPFYKYQKNLVYETETIHSLTKFMLSEKKYLQQTGFYSPTLAELHTRFYLDPDPNIIYSEILLFDSLEGRPCYLVSLRHAMAEVGFISNSCGKTRKLHAFLS
jgi:hypothetical protein